MNLQRVLEQLTAMADQSLIPRGITDEGRIFVLGSFDNDGSLHGRARAVVEGLREHVGQPFEAHPWAYVFELSAREQAPGTSPMTLVGVVWPSSDGSVPVKDYISYSKGLRQFNLSIFRHTETGTKVEVSASDDGILDAEDRLAASLYPLAIAILNTHGCSIDLKRAPGVTNARRKRLGKGALPAHHDVDASEYVTALRATAGSADRGGTHASPIPHLRRGHERVLSDGKRIWVRSALINVRNEGAIAFVERRKAFRRVEKQSDS